MIQAYPILHFYRITIEAATPLSITQGRGDGVSDTLLATDALGLPMIPATALAGVLRHAMSDTDDALARSLFGYIGKREGEGQRSRVEFSNARIHTSANSPVDALELASLDDPLLKPLVEASLPPTRRRVRIGHRGAAMDTGLFDRALVPAGHRFTFDLLLWCESDSGDAARRMEEVLFSDRLQAGGLTRSGFGRLQPKTVVHRRFDFRVAEDRKAWAEVPVRLDRPVPGLEQRRDPARITQRVTATLELHAEAGFRIGDGRHSFIAQQPDADDMPQSEARVVWSSAGQRVTGALQRAPDLLIPATSVKGALSHRIAFHFNRLTRTFATAQTVAGYEHTSCPAVRALFGSAKGTGTVDRPGNVYMDDVFIERNKVKPYVQQHTSIDRFTGGVRDGMLFDEENTFQLAVRLMIGIDTRRVEQPDIDADIALIKKALNCALEDLREGRLALGADSASGLGYFKGSITWSDQGQWIQGGHPA